MVCGCALRSAYCGTPGTPDRTQAVGIADARWSVAGILYYDGVPI
tara:strand:+ start:464 stop:598 length:135 start_codon:yes stop_codon:yes gene_type:complete